MSDTSSSPDKIRTTAAAVETAIQIGLALLLVASCLLILRPFVVIVAWGIILAVAAYPWFCKFQRPLGGRAGLAATTFTLLLLALVIIPTVLLGESLVGGIQSLVAKFKEGSQLIPPPPPNVSSWPLIGGPLSNIWELASTDLSELIRQFAPQLRAALPGILSASAGVTLTVLQLLLSMVIAGTILAKAESAYELTRLLASRLFGTRGPEFQHLVGATSRSVTFGIVGVALIQSVFAALGFYVVRLPGAGVWSAIFLVAAVLQVGMIVLIPAAIYVFAAANSTTAVIFLI